MLVKFWATTGVQMTSKCQKSEFGAESWHRRPFDSPEGRPTAQREHGRRRSGRTCCQKWALEASGWSHWAAPGGTSAQFIRKTYVFWSDQMANNWACKGAWSHEKLSFSIWMRKANWFAWFWGAQGRPLGAPFDFIQQMKLRRRARITLRDHRWSLKRFAMRIYEAMFKNEWESS